MLLWLQPRALRLDRIYLALLAIELPAACFSKLLLLTSTRGQPLLQILTFGMQARSQSNSQTVIPLFSIVTFPDVFPHMCCKYHHFEHDCLFELLT